MRHNDGIKEIKVSRRLGRLPDGACRHRALSCDADRQVRIAGHLERVAKELPGFSAEERIERDRDGSGCRYDALVWSPDRMEWGALTLAEAARRIGDQPCKVWGGIVKRYRVKGVAFAEEGEPWLGRDAGEALKRAVRCVNTGKEYSSGIEAARACGVRSSGNISKAIRRNGLCGGARWEFVGGGYRTEAA